MPIPGGSKEHWIRRYDALFDELLSAMEEYSGDVLSFDDIEACTKSAFDTLKDTSYGFTKKGEEHPEQKEARWKTTINFVVERPSCLRSPKEVPFSNAP